MSSQDLANRVISQLRARGYQALLVGGCVRDLLLGRQPKDYDVATNARPDQIVPLFPRSGLVGAQFGVVLVREQDAVVEVATFRSDLAYLDGRRPEGVRFETSPREDALRRDFTINGLFLDPVSGEKFDYVGGLADLQNSVIRAIGDPLVRFHEDHLRLIRAVRFAARLRFTIEPATFAAIGQLAPAIHRVAAERVREELLRILTEGGARYGFELLDSSGLLQEILPEIAAMKGVEQPPEFHPEGDVWTHTLMMLDGLDHPTPALAMGVLLHDVGKPPTFRVADRIRFDGHVEVGVRMAREILTRLRFSTEDAEQVLALVENHMKFKDVGRMRESTLKRFLRLPKFDEHLALHRLDCLNSNGNLDTWQMLHERLSDTPPEQLKPPPLITGGDLIAAGYPPGPRFGKVLAAIEDAQLEGRVATREQAMDLVRREWPDTRIIHVPMPDSKSDALVAPMRETDHREIGGLHLDIGKAGGCRIKRLIYPPGFRWSTHMKPVVNTPYCMHAHAGFLAQGRVHVHYEDGDTVELQAPQFVSIEPGHDAWVIGDQAAVLIEFDFERDTIQKLGMPDSHHHV